jgi:hypothetical protein
MHELPYNPTDYGSSEGPPLFPCRPTVKHRSHSLQRKAYICELAGSAAWLRSVRRIVRVIVAVAPFVCQIAASALFEPIVRAQTVSRLAAIDRFAKFIRALDLSSRCDGPDATHAWHLGRTQRSLRPRSRPV